MPKVETKVEPAPGLQAQINAATEAAATAGDHQSHAMLHTIAIRVGEVIIQCRDAERVLRGGDLGLALTLGSGLGGIGGLLSTIALGLTGPLGLIAALVALGLAVAGTSALLQKTVPKKDDGEAHPGQHWVEGHFHGHAGGYWADYPTRSAGPARNRHEEYWNPDTQSWDLSPYIASPKQPAPVSPYIAPAQSTTINMTVPVHVGNKKVHEEFFRIQGKSLNAPQVGPSQFDGWLSPTPAGGSGF